MVPATIDPEEEQVAATGIVLAHHILVGVGCVVCVGPQGDGEVVSQVKISRVDVVTTAVDAQGTAVGQQQVGQQRRVDDLRVAAQGAVGLWPTSSKRQWGDEPVVPSSIDIEGFSSIHHCGLDGFQEPEDQRPKGDANHAEKNRIRFTRPRIA